MSAPETSLRDILISDVGDDGFQALFKDAKLKSFQAGETIFLAGDPGRGVLLIESGRVEISTMSSAGKKSVLAHMAPGSLLGEIAALDGGNRSADATAATAVVGRFLARENLLEFIASQPKLAKSVIVELCGKARNASDMFLTQSAPEAEVRLARTMLKLFDTWGEVLPNGTVALTERFSQQDIGEFCGLARENVSRQISTWESSKILEKVKRKLILADRDALKALAES